MARSARRSAARGFRGSEKAPRARAGEARRPGAAHRRTRIARPRQASRVNHAAHAALLADRKSTRLNSSHSQISYAVFCLKKKKKTTKQANETTGQGQRTKTA